MLFPVNSDTPGQARDVEVSGDYAFVADGFDGFLALDISDPAAPRGRSFIPARTLRTSATRTARPCGGLSTPTQGAG
jgi:hypothetical protein